MRILGICVGLIGGLAFLTSGPAGAVSIQVDFSGVWSESGGWHVIYVGGTGFDLKPGTSYSGSVVFDTTAPNRSGDPSLGVYLMGAPSSFSLAVGGTPVSSDTFTVIVFNNWQGGAGDGWGAFITDDDGYQLQVSLGGPELWSTTSMPTIDQLRTLQWGWLEYWSPGQYLSPLTTWSIIPEPTTALLLATGLAGLAAAARRRRSPH